MSLNTEDVNVVPSARSWERVYWWRLFLTDSILVFLAVFGAQWIRFSSEESQLLLHPFEGTTSTVHYAWVSAALVISMLLVLELGGSRSPRVYGAGPEEYKTVINSTLLTFGLFALAGFSVRAQIGRAYLLIAVPVTLALLVIARYCWRHWLHNKRIHNDYVYRTVIVGHQADSEHVAKTIIENNYLGFELVGAITDTGSQGHLIEGVPVVGDYEGLLNVIDDLQINTLIMTSTDTISPDHMREIGWELETRNVEMILTAALSGIADSRIHARPVAGLPLIYVEHPEFRGWRLWLKRFVDVLGSALLLLLLSPIFFILAVLVKLDSPGPVFFKQTRIGLNGRAFSMYKYRSMVIDAEDLLEDLREKSDGNRVLFKMHDDPRVTRLGAIMRKYSLDELPQLWNVLIGNMSLVGPRPQLPREVEAYEGSAHRRLKVKPGITGLWQISGRSDLSWEDSVRLDLYYVENWSFIGDILILLRTVKTVLSPDGAY